MFDFLKVLGVVVATLAGLAGLVLGLAAAGVEHEKIALIIAGLAFCVYVSVVFYCCLMGK